MSIDVMDPKSYKEADLHRKSYETETVTMSNLHAIDSLFLFKKENPR